MADPNNVVLDEYGLVFFGPCKTANTSVRYMLADKFGKPRASAQSNAAWNHKTVQYIAEHCSDYLKIGFCRNPYERFASSYADQLVRRGRWDRLKLKRGMEYPEPEQVIDAIREISDSEIDQHWRSMTLEMFWNDQLIPDVVLRYEQLADDWDKTRQIIKDHCGLELPTLGNFNATDNKPTLSNEVRAKIARRYAEDFQNFDYPI